MDNNNRHNNLCEQKKKIYKFKTQYSAANDFVVENM